MDEINPASGAVKRKLLTLYESSPPQLFSQLLVDYDPERHKLSTEATRIYDLRAAARVQILFADGFKPAAAIKFLQETIRHIEAFGLPPSDEPVLYPHGEEATPRADVRPPPRIRGAQSAPASGLAPSNDESAVRPTPPPACPAPPAWAACQPGEVAEAAKVSLMDKIPALFSSLHGPGGFTLLNLDNESGAGRTQ